MRLVPKFIKRKLRKLKKSQYQIGDRHPLVWMAVFF